MVGGLCDFSVSPSPFGLDNGTSDLGLPTGIHLAIDSQEQCRSEKLITLINTCSRPCLPVLDPDLRVSSLRNKPVMAGPFITRARH